MSVVTLYIQNRRGNIKHVDDIQQTYFLTPLPKFNKMNLGSILILTLFVGNVSGILEQGFFDYSVSLAAGDDDVLVVGREVSQFF